MKKNIAAWLLAFVFFLPAGTARAADPEKARKKLAKEDIAFTPEEFLKKVFLGEEDVVQLFLEAGMPVDTADEKGSTALHAAARGDSEKTLAVILKAKPALNAKTKAGDTPLCRAAASGTAKNVTLLIQAGADVNAVCGFQKTALHEAAHEGDAAKVSALLAAGARTEARDEHGDTPLHLATSQETPAAAVALIRAKADVNAKSNHGKTPLHEATGWDKPAIVSALLQAGAEVDARDRSGHTALYDAASTERVRIVPLLLAAGADPAAKSPDGETPLKAARVAGNPRVVEMLAGARPAAARPASKSGPLAESGRATEPVRSSGDATWDLKKMGLRSDPNTLFERVEARDVKAVRLLLASGLSPALRNEQGRPPLYVAIEAGDEEMVRALVAAGANVNDPGANVDKSMEYGDTLVMKAVDRGDAEILKTLVAAKADVNKGNAYRVNGLMSAAMQGRADLVGILVKGGANVNGKDRAGTPVLYSAVKGGNPDAVRILIDAGADVSTSRKLLMDAAREKKNPRITEMLAHTPGGVKRSSARQSDVVPSDAAEPPPQSYPKPLSTGMGRRPLTGKQAYDMTWAVTAKWQKDAGLTELSTTSEGPLDKDGRSAHWVAHYFSPSAAQVYLTSIDDGKLMHFAHTSNELTTITMNADTILDTKRLRDIAEDAGGSKYTAKGARLSAGLVPNRGRALWYFNYEDAETSKNVATIVIDAQTGKVTLADLK
ncbi:MAG TPA: ankyrin repeat domain-containing protein [Thermoanaerobaculia bacterium]